jgi:lipoprotein-releasing system permease protein
VRIVEFPVRLRLKKIDVTDFIAFRHLTSRHNRGFVSFITFIAIIGVTLGVASLDITLAILGGFEKTIKQNVVSFTAHMQLFAFENNLLSDPELTVQKVIARFPEVLEMAPYLTREGMVRSKTEIDGILIKGVDPTNDISPAKRRLIEGSYDLDERESGVQTVILGKRLAEKLNVRLNDRVLIYALGGASLSISQTRIMQFEIIGIYETGMADYDASVIYINLRNAQRLCQVGKTASGFDILVANTDSLATFAQRIPEYLGYPYYARTMFQQYRNLFAWVDIQRIPVLITLALIIVVATVNIIGTLLMMILGKSREIGTLITIGMKRKEAVKIFLKQGMLIGLMGTFLGNLIAFLLCWLELRYRFFPLPPGIYFMTHVPIDLTVFNFLAVSIIALCMSFLASWIPSRLAARLDPITLIRFAQ